MAEHLGYSMFFHSGDVCQEFMESGICRIWDCNKRHPKDCRYWKRKKEGCRRNDLCQYLHNESKRYNVTNENTTLNSSNISSNSMIPPQHHQMQENTNLKCEKCEKPFLSKLDLNKHVKATHYTF